MQSGERSPSSRVRGRGSRDDLDMKEAMAVEQLVFGTPDIAEIDQVVDKFCVDTLGAGVTEVLFREVSVGVVFGVRLDDGRRVVLKAHQPRERPERLLAVQQIQAALRAEGLACPEPLLGPTVLVNGVATVEAMLDKGEFRNTHDPGCRRLIAEALARHLDLTSVMGIPESLAGGWSLAAGSQLWPSAAHSPIFDFEATAAGAEWIDALGRQAKSAIQISGQPIAGHGDWSAKHFRFSGDAISAIYDWDSLMLRDEAAVVGCAAMTFTTRFDLVGVPRAPAPEQMTAFLDEYGA
jgi:hypothetical protein